jgi:hypothetical protein
MKFTFQPMTDRLFMARLFLIGGGVLAAVGLILWLALPIQQGVSPYFATAILSLAYGAGCIAHGYRQRSSSAKPEPPSRRTIGGL